MKRFKKDDTVLLLIDYQTGTLDFAVSRPKKMIVNRMVALAKMAKALRIPVVLTSSQEDKRQGKLVPELQEILPSEYENRVRRTGVTNAWEDEQYKSAVLQAAGGRKNVIMSGLTNDVCIVYPSISMTEDGYDVQVVIDAGGSPTQIADEAARRTWEKAGVRTTAINQLFAEMTHSWETADGIKLAEIIAKDLIPTFSKYETVM